VMRAYIQFGLDNPSYYKLMFIENLEHYDRVITGDSDRLKGFILLVDLIGEAISSGVIAGHDKELISQSAWASLHGLTALLITFPGFYWKDREALIELHIDTYLKGLR
jgi:hypothetical protein